MLLINYKKEKDCLIFNDKENWLAALWFIAATVFFLYVGFVFVNASKEISFLVVAPFILSFIFLILFIDRFFVHDLIINKSTNNIRIKKTFIPLLLHNISLKECNKLIIYTVERISIGKYGTPYEHKSVFIDVLLKNGKQKVLAGFQFPIKMLSEPEDKINKDLLELQNVLNAELNCPVEVGNRKKV